jgi:N-acetylmuramoyl-L-alanine amidase
MTDAEVNYQGMALNVRKLLGDARAQWEPLYKKLLPDYQALETALTALDAKAQQRSGVSSTGYTDTKDLAEVAVLDAAMPVVQGLKAVYQDGQHPALGKVAGYTRSGLDKLRGLPQIAALEDLYNTAQPLAAELADEMVTAAQLELLRTRTAIFKPMVGAPRQQANSGSALREAAVQYLAEAHAAIEKLDVRVPNLKSALPDLVAAYEKARIIVDAGHGGKAKGGPTLPAK